MSGQLISLEVARWDRETAHFPETTIFMSAENAEICATHGFVATIRHIYLATMHGFKTLKSPLVTPTGFRHYYKCRLPAEVCEAILFKFGSVSDFCTVAFDSYMTKLRRAMGE